MKKPPPEPPASHPNDTANGPTFKPSAPREPLVQRRPYPASLTLWQGMLHTALVGLATGALAWKAGALTPPHTIGGLLALGAAAFSVVAARRGRIAHLELWMLEAGALASASAATGAHTVHLAAKPAAMAFALLFIAASAYRISPKGQFDHKSWGLLSTAVLASLAGDVCLMLRNLFIPGLVSFLLAHLAYTALLRRKIGAQQVHWFGSRTALVTTLALGVAMYTWLWRGGLPAELCVPVAVYVLVIALMAAQALGRAAQLQSASARTVALGACLFMVSDSLLAANRFVQALPMAELWVLSTYYAAQFCIVHGMVRALCDSAAGHAAQ